MSSFYSLKAKANLDQGVYTTLSEEDVLEAKTAEDIYNVKSKRT